MSEFSSFLKFTFKALGWVVLITLILIAVYRHITIYI